MSIQEEIARLEKDLGYNLSRLKRMINKELSKDTEIHGDVIITGAVTTTHKLGDVLKIGGKNLITKVIERSE